jgi:hypothetical protein
VYRHSSLPEISKMKNNNTLQRVEEKNSIDLFDGLGSLEMKAQRRLRGDRLASVVLHVDCHLRQQSDKENRIE